MNASNRIKAVALTSEIAAGIAGPPAEERRWPIPYRAIEPLAVLSDVTTIFLASLIAAVLASIGPRPVDFGAALGAALVVSALFVCLLKIHGFYRPVEMLSLRDQARAVAVAWTFVVVLMAIAGSALGMGGDISRCAGLFAALGPVALMAERVAVKRILVKGLSDRKFAGRKVVLVTDQTKTSAAGLARTLANHGFSVVQSFTLPPPDASLGRRKRFSAGMIDSVRGSDVAEIVIEADACRWCDLRSLAGELRVLPIPINFAPTGAAADFFRRPMRDFGSATLVQLQPGSLAPGEYAAKRALDLIGAGLALALVAPVFIIAAAAIKLDSPGPIFFRQQRCGFNGQRFTIRKFRTMTVLEDGPAIVQARQADHRVTRVGKWLRRTSIDELPQLLNVFDGTMSLVGPRPHALAHDNQFDQLVRNYAFRRRVKPGLSGWAQVHGCRGPTPTTAMVERRVEYDLWYIDNWSLRLDLTILMMTPIEVLRSRNAY